MFGSYVDTDDRDSDRYVVNVLQGGIGLPDETYYREEKFAEIRQKYLAYLVRLLTLAERPEPEITAAQVLALETRIAKGHWERAETRDVIKTYNLTPLSERARWCRASTSTPGSPGSAAPPRHWPRPWCASPPTSPTSRPCWPTPASRSGARS